VESIVYSDGQIRYGPPELLTVQGDGRIHYESHTNEFRQAQQDIGVYEAALPAASLGELKAALMSPPLDSLPDHAGRLGFDGRLRTVRVTFADRVVTKSVNLSDLPVDPRLELVMAQLEKIASAALGNPLRVLHIDLENVTVNHQGAVQADATFSNPGTQLAQCRAPTFLIGLESDSLALESGPASDSGPWNGLRSTVSMVRELSRRGGAVVQGSLLELPPQASISYRISGTLAWTKAGPAFVQLVYRSTETPPDAGPALLTGQVRATAKTVLPR
jgi:hypothetical protein